jgi:hypothetical protein
MAVETEVKDRQFANAGRLPISRLVSELRFHAMVVNFAKWLGADTETRSPEQLAIYFLSSYVKRVTGDFHDRCVSGLIAGAAPTLVRAGDGYDQEAHRQWRSRNYARLEKHYSWMVRFIVAMSVVIERSA